MRTTRRAHPPVSNIKTFQATNHKECEGFLNKLEIHFELHERFFRDNERPQVATGASLLENELLSHWRQEGKTPSNPHLGRLQGILRKGNHRPKDPAPQCGPGLCKNRTACPARGAVDIFAFDHACLEPVGFGYESQVCC